MASGAYRIIRIFKITSRHESPSCGLAVLSIREARSAHSRHNTATRESAGAAFRGRAAACRTCFCFGSNDQTFAHELFARENMLTLPGSYLSQTAEDVNPGQNRVRMALVASHPE
jgi:aspartate/methionine/tyrosine aminotransferase